MTPREEIANSITHAIGLVLSVLGAVALVGSAVRFGDIWHIVGCTIFSATMIAVYAASTLSHIYQRPRPRRLFRILDQAFIYLFIVGTYTPLALTYLRDGWWWLLLIAMWGVALVGFFSKILLAHRIDAVSLIVYLLLGWMPILSVRPLLSAAPSQALLLMLAGGLCYTLGTLFLSLDQRVPYFHSVWHLLVIAGSACHYVAIALYVVPAGV